MNIYPVVLCGGRGTDLWPMSRGGYPKQYLRLTGKHTLVQQTVLRRPGFANVAEPIVIANQDQRFLVADQLHGIGVAPGAIVLEPMKRNTAPAVAVAVLIAIERPADALLMVLPSDHIILDSAVFSYLVSVAADIAGKGATS